MNSFWDEKTSEYEMLQDNLEDSVQEILDEYEENDSEEEYEEEYEEEQVSNYTPTNKKVAYRLNKKENTIVTDAMIRLEQARLYDMLIKHDLFKGVKAHPRALANVQSELKSYIVNRLEILLGIRKEKKEVELPRYTELTLPFNELEVDFLKALSGKGTKGASKEIDQGMVLRVDLKTQTEPVEYQDEEDEEYEEEYEGLQPLEYDEPIEEEEYEEEYIEPPKPKRKVAKKKTAPKKPSPERKVITKKNNAPVQKNIASRAKLNRNNQISDTEAERIAREDMERMKGRKSANKMSAEELIEANKKINSGRSSVKAQGAKPIPTGSNLEMYYQTKQANQTANSGGFNVLLNQILSSKK